MGMDQPAFNRGHYGDCASGMHFDTYEAKKGHCVEVVKYSAVIYGDEWLE